MTERNNRGRGRQRSSRQGEPIPVDQVRRFVPVARRLLDLVEAGDAAGLENWAENLRVRRGIRTGKRYSGQDLDVHRVSGHILSIFHWSRINIGHGADPEDLTGE